MSNCWVEFLKYMNMKEIGDVFSRQDMFEALNEWPHGALDSYRALAKKKNFLKSAGRGKYQVIRKFPMYVILHEFYNIPKDNLGYLEYVLSKKEKQDETSGPKQQR
jgi:hypothetical protein